MSHGSLRHELIRASAGAGKTYALTNRFLRLLRMGNRPDDILASTFTRKAAGEILAGVLLRVAQAATHDKKLAELQAALNGEPLTRDDCLALLARTARRLHRLRIGTLDSFFAQLAGSFALEIGLPPGWRIAEQHEDTALRTRALEAVLDNEDAGSLLALVHALTRGETTRSLDREVRDKIDSLHAVYRESSQAAWHRLKRETELTAAQLQEAIETLRSVPVPAHKTWESTRVKELAAAEAGDWLAFIQGGIASRIAADEESYCKKKIEPAVCAAYRGLIDHARAVLLNQLANQTEATYQLLEKFDTQYQQLKQQSRALRFDDITFQLAARMRVIASDDSPAGALVSDPSGVPSQPTPDRVAFRLDAQLQHILLDEFQDTSLAQWSVIRPFALGVTSPATGNEAANSSPSSKPTKRRARPAERRGHPRELRPQGEAMPSSGSFFCVGDTKQAIYGWRGGVAEIFDAVTRELSGLYEEPLDTSWRSSPHVIAAVNQIFQNLQRHSNLGELASAVTRWQQEFNEHRTAEPKRGYNGYVCLQAARVPHDDEADSPKDITLRFAAEQVAEWQKRAPGFDVGVLVRRNDAVRRLIYELRELGIEASEEGGSSLDDSAAVRLVLSLMQLADHPGDLVARFHIATSPLARTLEVFQAGSDDQPTGGAADDADARRLASGLDNVQAGGLARRVRRQLADRGYGPTVYALARQLAPSCNRRELRRLEKLIGLAYQYEDLATSRPRDFAAYVAAAKVRDPIAADVRVMTVHQAKGLEFDIVVLADLEADLIGQRADLVVGRPSPTEPIERVCRRCSKDLRQLMSDDWQRLFREADEQDVAESLCVLYVAVTRARHALHMIVAPSATNERSLHKTFGGLLRAALTDGQPLAPEHIAYETGDRQWFQRPGVEHAASAAQVLVQAESLAPLEVRLAAPGERRRRGLQRVSPSGLEGGRYVRLSKSLSEGSADRAAALAYGTLIHAWFEQVQWLDDGAPDDDKLRLVAAALPELVLSNDDIDRALADFRAMLARPAIAACLERSAYRGLGGDTLWVEAERPIAVRDGDRLLVGNVDRWVTVQRGGQTIAADIIDFKTDVVASGNAEALADKVDYYRPQISAYRSAVCSILGLEAGQVSAKLLFVRAGRVELL